MAVVPPKEPPKPKGPSFEILKGSEIWRPRPPMAYMIDGFLPKGCLGMFCALGETHKSWLLVDMALAVAKGRPWLHKFATGTPKRVLYLDYENNEDETARRIVGLEQSPIENFHMAVMPDLFLTDKKFLVEIEALVRQYDFIAIDSLSGGSIDISENDPKFAQSLRYMKRAAAKSGAGFVILHHSRKPQRGRDGEEIEESNRKNKPRGTSAIYNALDALLDIESIDDNRSRVMHTKKRGPRKLEPFTACIIGTAPEPTRIFVLSEEDTKEAKRIAKLKTAFIQYQQAIGKKAVTANELVKQLKRRKQAVLDELTEFVKLEWLSLENGLFSMPSKASSAGSRGGSEKKGLGNHLTLVPGSGGSQSREPAEPA